MLLQGLGKEEAFHAENKSCLGHGGKEERNIFYSVFQCFTYAEDWPSQGCCVPFQKAVPCLVEGTGAEG